MLSLGRASRIRLARHLPLMNLNNLLLRRCSTSHLFVTICKETQVPKMAAGDTIGMMEGAFFVSRSELLSWINNLLKINMTKVEQMASGAAYC
jgi:hypothetical protein